jgi:hypothetical protein
MKKVFVALLTGLTLMAGSTAFAASGGADGGGRLAEANIARNYHALEAYAANKAAQTTSQVASVDK